MENKNTKKFSEYYKKKNVTSSYDNQREKTGYRKEKRAKELEIFLELLDKQKNEKVLELGCSSGFLTKHLGRVTAIDTSEGMLEICQEKNPRAKCIVADMFHLPFKNNSFDKVVTMRVWNHLDRDDLKKALKEARRVLKKDGILVFDIEEKNLIRKIIHFFYKRVFRTTGYKICQYSLKETKEILSREGFKIIKLKGLKHRIGRQVMIKAVKGRQLS